MTLLTILGGWGEAVVVVEEESGEVSYHRPPAAFEPYKIGDVFTVDLPPPHTRTTRPNLPITPEYLTFRRKRYNER